MAGKQMVGGCIGFLVLAALLHAQEQPLSVIGTFTTGFYETSAHGDTNQSMKFIPVSARFEMNGYVKSADLLTFWAQPELAYGPQASEAGFQSGTGIRFRVTAFRKLIPLTFRYANIREEDVFIGSLSQVSGYTLQNANHEIGLTLTLKSRKLPTVIIDWGSNVTKAKSGIAEFSDFVTDSSHVTADAHYERWGWTMGGFAHYRTQRSDILEIAEAGKLQMGTLDQTMTQFQGQASRSFWSDSTFFVDAGRQASDTVMFDPIDLSTRYGDVNLMLFQKHRVRTSVRFSYWSNMGSELAAQEMTAMTTTGSAVPDQNSAQALTHGVSSYFLNDQTNVTLGHGFEAYLGLERRAFMTPTQKDAMNADYWAGSAGLIYQHRMSWGVITGEYGRQLGIGTVTGQSGNVEGQVFQGSLQTGNGNGMQIEGLVRGSTQSIQSIQPIANHNISAEGSISRHIIGNFKGRIGGGYQWATVENSGVDSHSGGYTAQVGIIHPIAQVSASMNDTVSNTLPIYDSLLGGIGSAVLLPPMLTLVPTSYRATTISVHTNPLPKLEFTGTWTKSHQQLYGLVNNDFEFIDAFATYRFRRIQLEGGYLYIRQAYSLYLPSARSRVYVRISRREKLL